MTVDDQSTLRVGVSAGRLRNTVTVRGSLSRRNAARLSSALRLVQPLRRQTFLDLSGVHTVEPAALATLLEESLRRRDAGELPLRFSATSRPITMALEHAGYAPSLAGDLLLSASR
jgi:ABC-type transporter Mla MlaB component